MGSGSFGDEESTVWLKCCSHATGRVCFFMGLTGGNAESVVIGAVFLAPDVVKLGFVGHGIKSG